MADYPYRSSRELDHGISVNHKHWHTAKKTKCKLSLLSLNKWTGWWTIQLLSACWLPGFVSGSGDTKKFKTRFSCTILSLGFWNLSLYLRWGLGRQERKCSQFSREGGYVNRRTLLGPLRKQIDLLESALREDLVGSVNPPISHF